MCDGVHDYGEPEPWGLTGGHVRERCRRDACGAFRIVPTTETETQAEGVGTPALSPPSTTDA